MKTDIYQKIEQDFGDDCSAAIEYLELVNAQSKGLIGDRLIRTIVYLAKGNLSRLDHAIDLSRTDYRDVLWQAEYDCGEVRLFDFNLTFHELNLIKKSC